MTLPDGAMMALNNGRARTRVTGSTAWGGYALSPEAGQWSEIG
jgi:hypothetical protein